MDRAVHRQIPRVGIGVMVLKDGKVLLGKRKGSHGAGEYAFPGGHLDYMETFQSCAKREVMEETGMEIEHVRFVRLSNITAYAPKHYVHIGLAADWKKGEPEVREPEKCEGWDWYSLEKLPQPLFKTLPEDIEAYKTGKYFYDIP